MRSTTLLLTALIALLSSARVSGDAAVDTSESKSTEWTLADFNAGWQAGPAASDPHASAASAGAAPLKEHLQQYKCSSDTERSVPLVVHKEVLLPQAETGVQGQWQANTTIVRSGCFSVEVRLDGVLLALWSSDALSCSPPTSKADTATGSHATTGVQVEARTTRFWHGSSLGVSVLTTLPRMHTTAGDQSLSTARELGVWVYPECPTSADQRQPEAQAVDVSVQVRRLNLASLRQLQAVSNSRSNTRTPSSTRTPTRTSSRSRSSSRSLSPSRTPSPDSYSNSPSWSSSTTSTTTTTFSRSFTPSATPTISISPSRGASASNSATFSATDSVSATTSRTSTLSATATDTPTASYTASDSRTVSETPTVSRTSSRSSTTSRTPSRTASESSFESQSRTASRSATVSVTPTLSGTQSATPTYSATVTVTGSTSSTRTFTPSPTSSFSVGASRSVTPSTTPTISFTSSETPTISITPSISRTKSESLTPSSSVSVSPTASDDPAGYGACLCSCDNVQCCAANVDTHVMCSKASMGTGTLVAIVLGVLVGVSVCTVMGVLAVARYRKRARKQSRDVTGGAGIGTGRGPSSGAYSRAQALVHEAELDDAENPRATHSSATGRYSPGGHSHISHASGVQRGGGAYDQSPGNRSFYHGSEPVPVGQGRASVRSRSPEAGGYRQPEGALTRELDRRQSAFDPEPSVYVGTGSMYSRAALPATHLPLADPAFAGRTTDTGTRVHGRSPLPVASDWDVSDSNSSDSTDAAAAKKAIRMLERARASAGTSPQGRSSPGMSHRSLSRLGRKLKSALGSDSEARGGRHSPSHTGRRNHGSSPQAASSDLYADVSGVSPFPLATRQPSPMVMQWPDGRVTVNMVDPLPISAVRPPSPARAGRGALSGYSSFDLPSSSDTAHGSSSYLSAGAGWDSSAEPHHSLSHTHSARQYLPADRNPQAHRDRDHRDSGRGLPRHSTVTRDRHSRSGRSRRKSLTRARSNKDSVAVLSLDQL